MKLDILIADWISNNDLKEDELQGIEAINFGIFESPNGYTIYLSGAKLYDPDDDDWSTSVDYEPTNKYLILSKEVTKELDWTQILDLVVNSLKVYLDTESFLSSSLAKIKVITTGFDDGDLIRIK